MRRAGCMGQAWPRFEFPLPERVPRGNMVRFKVP